MLDAFLFLFVMGLLALGLRKPFIWVLAYLYIDIVAPQKIGWTFMQLLPFSLIAFVAAFAGWLLADSKEGSRFTFRQGLILVLLIYCGVTTLTADFPKEALEKWGWVWKAMVFAIFLPLTLRTKLRIEAAALVMVLSVGAIIISGGIKTLLGGGGYGELYFFVNDNTGLYESSIISCVAIAIIPLVLWLAKYGTVYPTDLRVKLVAAGLIFAALLIPVGTEARTGLLCIGVLAVLMLRSVKRRFLYMALGGVALLMAVPFLPQSFTERMSTIEKHEGDESASTRVAVWMWTLDYVKDHPFGGGFDAYRSNSFTYKTRVTLDMGSGITQTETQDVTDKARAYHSSYFEMLGEQGWPGFILWIWLHALGLWQMELLRRRYIRRARLDPRQEDAWKAPLATALQQAQIVYLVGSLFVGIAFQPFILMLIGLQCALWSYLNRVDSPAKKRIGRARRAAPPPGSADAVAAEAGALH
ncbi:putative O-glycosylation ligase, exosortase A system-associated [Altererythrobacter sp. CC-YST694]|uniref:putative O-glycosylation ligase, exosortase A system-associated n=1 Tax=Altererythrobacter sp. CC-YST694 TaxID=2755038 RepID=UPI001D01F189|nr:putative O-glycosylation ligase, exosortase A system-associated [Altererythrobacter sp. CC-YST694]MCB5425554.1 putative O-glycosylation ligase, exosortase A system-associated [Altererythrobacter sp. CC-YST694]